MRKMTTKIIAIVLVLTMAISGLVINTSAYSVIAGIVDVVHILTDLKVTDGPLGSDAAKDIADKLGVDGVKKLVSTIKVLGKAGIGIDDLVDAIKLLTDLKVTDNDALVKIAKAIISSAKNPGIIDIDDLVDFLKILTDIDLDGDALKAFVSAIVDALKLTDIDCDGLKKILAVIVDAVKGNIGGIEVPDFDLGDLDLGKFDLDAFKALIKGLGNKDIDLDGLKALIKALNPNFDFGDFDITGLLAKIKGGNIDISILKALFEKIGLPKFDTDILTKILDLIKGGNIELPDFDLGDLDLGKFDLDAFKALIKGLGNKDIDLDGLKALIKALNPNFDFGDFDITGLLAKIKGGNIDISILKDLFEKIGLPKFDTDILTKILDLIKGGNIELPDADLKLDAFLELIKGLGNKDLDLDGLKLLIKALIPDFDFNGVDFGDILDKIHGGNLDFPTLKDFFDKLGFPELDVDFILGLLDLIIKGGDITLPDLEDMIGKLPGVEIDPTDWLKDILDKIKTPTLPDFPTLPGFPGWPTWPSDPADPSDPTVDVTDPSIPLDPETQETIETVDKLVDIVVDDSTPQGYVPAESDPVIANTGDAAIVGVASVTLLAAAAFVTTSKKKEN